MPNISLVGHHHTCPKVTARKSHVGGAVLSGQSLCTVNGKAVAILGDTCACEIGGPDPIVSGSALMSINGVPVAFVGSSTAHGGKVVEGDASLTTL